MRRSKRLVPKRERVAKPDLKVPEALKHQLGEMELQDLLREARQDFELRIQRGLSSREMYENAFHEAGHAVAAVCLGIGPLPPGIKLYPRGRLEKGEAQVRWGITQLCQWSPSEGVVRAEIENSILSLLAGREAQNKLTIVFAEHGWDALPAQFALANELDGAWRDDVMVRGLLKHIPLQVAESESSILTSLLDRTRRTLDQNWPAVRAVSRAVLKQKHYSLAGKQITAIVNRTMGTRYRVIRRCTDI